MSETRYGYVSEEYAPGQIYFAYDDLTNGKIANRYCQGIELIGSAVLENYELRFMGEADRSGEAVIARKEGSQVEGVLWRLPAYGLLSLNEAKMCP